MQLRARQAAEPEWSKRIGSKLAGGYLHTSYEHNGIRACLLSFVDDHVRNPLVAFRPRPES